MRYSIILAIFGVLLLVACQPAAEEVPAPQAPPPAPAPEPAPVVEETPAEDDLAVPLLDVDTEAAEDTGTVLTLEESRQGASVITVDDIECNVEERAITFTFRNTESVNTWFLGDVVPLVLPMNTVRAQVEINEYDANSGEQFRDGVKLFGPNDNFPDNCGGVETLAPGEEITCTVAPVYIKPEGVGMNEIAINVPGSSEDGIAFFSC